VALIYDRAIPIFWALATEILGENIGCVRPISAKLAVKEGVAGIFQGYPALARLSDGEEQVVSFKNI